MEAKPPFSDKDIPISENRGFAETSKDLGDENGALLPNLG